MQPELMGAASEQMMSEMGSTFFHKKMIQGRALLFPIFLFPISRGYDDFLMLALPIKS